MTGSLMPRSSVPAVSATAKTGGTRVAPLAPLAALRLLCATSVSALAFTAVTLAGLTLTAFTLTACGDDEDTGDDTGSTDTGDDDDATDDDDNNDSDDDDNDADDDDDDNDDATDDDDATTDDDDDDDVTDDDDDLTDDDDDATSTDDDDATSTDDDDATSTDDDDATSTDDDDDATSTDDDDATDTGDEFTDVFVGTEDPFQLGTLNIKTVDLAEDQAGAPKALRIYAPVAQGTYPVIQFQHGFATNANDYSEMLKQIASHGFVIVAPQMYNPLTAIISAPSSDQEIQDALAITAWIAAGIDSSAGVTVREDLFGFVGHSRGGKVSFGASKLDNGANYDAWVGVDPVDGGGPPFGPAPPGNGNQADAPATFPFPSLVLGMGRGAEGITPCAPEDDNYAKFYGAAPEPVWLVVLKDAGHSDMYNNRNILCPGASNIAPQRSATAGLTTAFLRAYLQGDNTALAALSDPSEIPVTVTVENRGAAN